jgi:outer membrane protein assembly factor BamB
MNHLRLISLMILSLLVFAGSAGQPDYMQQWPGFRGPFATGIIEYANTPVNWDAASGRNIRWRREIPGLGHASPVIWDDKIFVTTAVSGSGEDYLKVGLYGDIDMVDDETVHEFRVYCLDKHTGEVMWDRLAHIGVPRTRRHTKSSHANCTPATDGRFLVVYFGSEGLYCYDLDGNLIWEKDLGAIYAGPYTDPEVEWGIASSPVIRDGKVIMQCDVTGEDFLALFDVKTGEEIWRTPRDEVSTWSTPAIYEQGGNTQIILNGYRHMGGYDFETGREIWKMSGGGDAPVPTPVIAHGLIYLNNAHGRYSPIYVVRPEARGDITLDKDSTTSEFIVWSIKRGGAYMQTPLIYGDYLYNLRGNGSLSCYQAITGGLMYRESLGVSGGVTASGIASGGKLYFTSENGKVYVVAAGPVFKRLTVNNMDDICMATPAISQGALYFRTAHYLIAVSER